MNDEEHSKRAHILTNQFQHIIAYTFHGRQTHIIRVCRREK